MVGSGETGGGAHLMRLSPSASESPSSTVAASSTVEAPTERSIAASSTNVAKNSCRSAALK
eukprot:4177272-Prymnesium_polylepis.2